MGADSGLGVEVGIDVAAVGAAPFRSAVGVGTVVSVGESAGVVVALASGKTVLVAPGDGVVASPVAVARGVRVGAGPLWTTMTARVAVADGGGVVGEGVGIGDRVGSGLGAAVG